MEQKTIAQQIEEITSAICDNYCKWPSQYHSDEDTERMWDEHCNDCPLMRF